MSSKAVLGRGVGALLPDVDEHRGGQCSLLTGKPRIGTQPYLAQEVIDDADIGFQDEPPDHANGNWSGYQWHQDGDPDQALTAE